jgi:hypothetical protein
MTLSSIDADTLLSQANAAGYADPEMYLRVLLERDAARLAIVAGIEDAEAGHIRSFAEFDREFRAKHHLKPRV